MKTDEIQQHELGVREEFPSTWGKLLGMTLIRNGTGQATVEFEVDRERHGNPARTVHGGLLCEIADSAMATGSNTSPSKLRSRVNQSFLRSTPGAEMREANVVGLILSNFVVPTVPGTFLTASNEESKIYEPSWFDGVSAVAEGCVFCALPAITRLA